MHKIVCICLIIVLTISGLVLFADAETQVGGILTADTTWTKEGSPYTLNANMLIKNGITLTIEPGTSVNLGIYLINVEETGVITAKGTKTDKISFQGGSIQFMSGPVYNEQNQTGSIIENCIFESSFLYSGNAKVTNNIINGNVTAGTSLFSNNEISGWVRIASRGQFLNNTVMKYLAIDAGTPTISNNTILQGITCSGENTRATISYNNIKGDIVVHWGHPLILGNNIEGNLELRTESVISQNTIYGTIGTNANSTIIANNNISSANAGIGIGSSMMHAQNVTIINNIFSGCAIGIAASDTFYLTITNEVTIRGNLFKNNEYGLKIDEDKNNLTIEKNLFLNNKYGAVIEPGNGLIQHNTFAGNDIGLSANGEMHHNNFQDNNISLSLLIYKVFIGFAENATYNWWGTTDVQAINQTIYDFKNDYNLKNITFTPFLTAPDSQAPTTNYLPVQDQEITLPSTSPSPTPSTSASTQTPSPTSTPPQSTLVPTNTATAPTSSKNNASIDTQTSLLIGIIAVLAIAVGLLAVKLRKKER